MGLDWGVHSFFVPSVVLVYFHSMDNIFASVLVFVKFKWSELHPSFELVIFFYLQHWFPMTYCTKKNSPRYKIVAWVPSGPFSLVSSPFFFFSNPHIRLLSAPCCIGACVRVQCYYYDRWAINARTLYTHVKVIFTFGPIVLCPFVVALGTMEDGSLNTVEPHLALQIFYRMAAGRNFLHFNWNCVRAHSFLPSICI